jgi:hypothetical protein
MLLQCVRKSLQLRTLDCMDFYYISIKGGKIYEWIGGWVGGCAFVVDIEQWVIGRPT